MTLLGFQNGGTQRAVAVRRAFGNALGEPGFPVIIAGDAAADGFIPAANQLP